MLNPLPLFSVELKKLGPILLHIILQCLTLFKIYQNTGLLILSLVRENTSQRKPVFWYSFRRVMKSFIGFLTPS